MQIFLVSVVILVSLALIIFKINNKFEKKEQKIYLVILSLIVLIFVSYNYNQDDILPELFKKEYSSKNKIEILKLSSELLNNKLISSKNKYVYKFTYIIKKDTKQYICTANNVEILKLDDEFIISKYTEECKEK